MRIILVRHGETDYNAAKVIQGWLPSHLTDVGKAQAKKTGKYLSTQGIDKIYCSDLMRTRDTADEILKFVKKPIVYVEWLREIKMGEYEGKPKGSRRKYCQEHYLDLLAYQPKGGESILQFRKRIVDAFDSFLLQEKSSIVLLITHGGVIFQILLHLLQLHESELEKYDPTNCSITIVDIHKNGHTFHAINSTDHLTVP